MQTNEPRRVTVSTVVGARVRRWLDEQERSQAWLARKLGVTDSTVGRRLTAGGWTVAELERLAGVVGVTPSALVDTTDTTDVDLEAATERAS